MPTYKKLDIQDNFPKNLLVFLFFLIQTFPSIEMHLKMSVKRLSFYSGLNVLDWKMASFQAAKLISHQSINSEKESAVASMYFSVNYVGVYLISIHTK